MSKLQRWDVLIFGYRGREIRKESTKRGTLFNNNIHSGDCYLLRHYQCYSTCEQFVCTVFHSQLIWADSYIHLSENWVGWPEAAPRPRSIYRLLHLISRSALMDLLIRQNFHQNLFFHRQQGSGPSQFCMCLMIRCTPSRYHSMSSDQLYCFHSLTCNFFPKDGSVSQKYSIHFSSKNEKLECRAQWK